MVKIVGDQAKMAMPSFFLQLRLQTVPNLLLGQLRPVRWWARQRSQFRVVGPAPLATLPAVSARQN